MPNRPRYFADVLGYVRPEVLRYAVLMERELRANDHKPGWKNNKPADLMERVEEEFVEFREVMQDFPLNPHSEFLMKDLVAEEASDVSNMIMMILDVMNVLPELQPCSPLEKARNTLIERCKDLLKEGGFMFVDVESWMQKHSGPLKELAQAFLEVMSAEKADEERKAARNGEALGQVRVP